MTATPTTTVVASQINASRVTSRGFVATAYQGSSAIILARIIGLDGDPQEKADLSTITCLVTDITPATPEQIDEPAVVIADTVFDVLQTDANWSYDATGYNFKHSLAGTCFPEAGHIYEVQYTFTPVGGGPCIVLFRMTTEATRTPEVED